MSGAELAHLVLGEAEEAVVARIPHGAVLDEHVQLGARRVLGDGEDARHVGELDVGLGFEQLLQEHEGHALVVLGEQRVEEHRVPFVHEAEARLRGVVDALERREQAGPRLDARLGGERAQVVDEVRADDVDVVPVAPTLVGQRAEVDVDDVVGSEMCHGRGAAEYFEPLEQRSRVQAAREKLASICALTALPNRRGRVTQMHPPSLPMKGTMAEAMPVLSTK